MVLCPRLNLFCCCCAKHVPTHTSTFICKAPLCLLRKLLHLPHSASLPARPWGVYPPKMVGGAFTMWPWHFSHFCFDRGRLLALLLYYQAHPQLVVTVLWGSMGVIPTESVDSFEARLKSTKRETKVRYKVSPRFGPQPHKSTPTHLLGTSQDTPLRGMFEDILLLSCVASGARRLSSESPMPECLGLSACWSCCGVLWVLLLCCSSCCAVYPDTAVLVEAT